MGLLCRLNLHRFSLAFRRYGERVPCERGCGAYAKATRHGWAIYRNGQNIGLITDYEPRDP